MTMTEPGRDTRDTARDTDLSDTDLRSLAREAYRTDRSLTGGQLGDRFWRGDRAARERWGRRQIAAVEPVSVDRPPAPAVVSAPVRPVTPKRTPGPVRPDSERTPLPLLALTGAAVTAVVVVTAVVSYLHIRHLAQVSGMGGVSAWLPVGLDGLVVACSCSLIADRRRGMAGHPLAWAGAAIGLAASVAANVLAVDPTLVSVRAVRWVLAGYAPVALAVSGHLLHRMLGDR